MSEPAQEAVVHVHLNVTPKEEPVHPQRLHDRVVTKQVLPRRRLLIRHLLHQALLPERRGEATCVPLRSDERVEPIDLEVPR